MHERKFDKLKNRWRKQVRATVHKHA